MTGIGCNGLLAGNAEWTLDEFILNSLAIYWARIYFDKLVNRSCFASSLRCSKSSFGFYCQFDKLFMQTKIFFDNLASELKIDG